MGAQGIIVALLVIAAAVYVVRALAPTRWLRRHGLARRGAGSVAAGTAPACGCSSCPPGKKSAPTAAARGDGK